MKKNSELIVGTIFIALSAYLTIENKPLLHILGYLGLGLSIVMGQHKPKLTTAHKWIQAVGGIGGASCLVLSYFIVL